MRMQTIAAGYHTDGPGMRCGEGLRGAPCSASQRNGAEMLRWTFADSTVPCGVSAHHAMSMSAHQAARPVVLLQRIVPCCNAFRGSRHCYACQPCTHGDRADRARTIERRPSALERGAPRGVDGRCGAAGERSCACPRVCCRPVESLRDPNRGEHVSTQPALSQAVRPKGRE
jgi:hypothetical protein